MSARRRLVAGLSALTLVGTLLGAGVVAGTAAGAATGVPAAALAAADEVVETNVALIAEPTVSYVPGWNKASALNDGTEATPDGHGSVWGTYGQFEAQHWAQYDWQWPVTVSRSAVWFWNDANGSANVLSPAAWHLEYKDAAGDFQPVDVATYPIATGTAQVLGPNTVTFTPVTTTALRIVLTRRSAARPTRTTRWPPPSGRRGGPVAPSPRSPSTRTRRSRSRTSRCARSSGRRPAFPTRCGCCPRTAR